MEEAIADVTRRIGTPTVAYEVEGGSGRHAICGRVGKRFFIWRPGRLITADHATSGQWSGIWRGWCVPGPRLRLLR